MINDQPITPDALTDMDLHAVLHPHPDIEVLRVLGGWVYTHIDIDDEMNASAAASVFVPEVVSGE